MVVNLIWDWNVVFEIYIVVDDIDVDELECLCVVVGLEGVGE